MVETFLSYAQAIGDLCVIGITLYTFYLTFYSKRIDYVSCGVSSEMFGGSSLSFVFQSKTMRTISIKNILLIMNDGNSVLFKMKNKVTVEGRRSADINTEKFTKIIGIKNLSDFTTEIKTIILETDEFPICVRSKSLKFIPSCILKKRYSKGMYHPSCTVSSTIVDEKVVSDMVKYVIYILSEKEVVNVLMTKNGITNIAVGGHNGYKLPSDDVNEIKEYLAETWNIDPDRVSVNKVGMDLDV